MAWPWLGAACLDLLGFRRACSSARDANNESQPEFWIETRKLPKATASAFYRKLDETLEAIGFTAGVREVCRPAYAGAGRGGRIDPVVYWA